MTKGAAGAEQALLRTWEEPSTSQELHKGVEFGVKAAGEDGKSAGGGGRHSRPLVHPPLCWYMLKR
ncbi:MAG: hypothetical protein AB7E46_13525 [Desulfovibrio sp.]